MKVVVATASLSTSAAIGMLVSAQVDLKLAGEAADLTELQVLVKEKVPQAIVLDWDAYGERIGELQQLLERLDSSPVLVALSVNDQLRGDALAAGVSYFAHKGSPPSQRLEAIRQADAAGETPILINTIQRDRS